MLWSPKYGATINGELLRETYTYNEFQEMIYNGNLFITDWIIVCIMYFSNTELCKIRRLRYENRNNNL